MAYQLFFLGHVLKEILRKC